MDRRPQAGDTVVVTLPDRLYAIKEMAFRTLPALKNIVAAGRSERDAWIASAARAVAAGSVVLDIGAGSAPYRRHFAHCRYIAQDLAALQSSQLQGRAGYARLDVISDIGALPLGDSICDVVVCTEVLEHVPEPIRAVAEIGRVLKPGGIALISAPLRSTLHQAPFHFYGGFTPFWYEKFLAQQGFSSICVEPVGGFFRSYAHATLCFALHLSPFEGRLWKRVLFFPAWCLAVLWFALLSQFVCRALDRMYFIASETGGYHVAAVKNPAKDRAPV